MSRTYRRRRNKKQHQQHRKNADFAKEIWQQDDTYGTWRTPGRMVRLQGRDLDFSWFLFHRDKNIVGSPVRKFARAEEERACRQRNAAEILRFLADPEAELFFWDPESIRWCW